MKKDIKNFGKWIEIIFIILTFISLIIDAFEYTYSIYNTIYDVTKLNNFLISTPFTITLWIDNVLIILFGIFYIIDTIKQKKNVFLKLSFCIFSICTTMIVASLIINGIAEMFGLF